MSMIMLLLDSSAFDLTLHGFGKKEIVDLCDIVVEHIIQLLESEESGSMERVGAVL